MADMATTIKRIVQNVLENWALTDYAAGTIVSASPLRVQLNQKVVLEPINLLATSETPVLAAGDKVVMLRTQRGQKYIILGKVVE